MYAMSIADEPATVNVLAVNRDEARLVPSEKRERRIRGKCM